MTEDELKEIEDRCNAATAGEWRVDPFGSVLQIVRLEDCKCPDDMPDCLCGEFITDFIAHSRTDIPALIAEVRKLEAENNKLQDTIQGMGIELTELRVNKLCMDEHERIYEALGCEHEGEVLAKIQSLKNQLSKSIALQQDKPISPILRAYLNGEL